MTTGGRVVSRTLLEIRSSTQMPLERSSILSAFVDEVLRDAALTVGVTPKRKPTPEPKKPRRTRTMPVSGPQPASGQHVPERPPLASGPMISARPDTPDRLEVGYARDACAQESAAD
jgi:hypothetical protein